MLDSSELSMLISQMVSNDDRSCWKAADALIQANSRRATKPLLRMMKGGVRAEVRVASIRILGELGDRRARRVLENILNKKEQPPRVRGYAAEALGNVGDLRSLPVLIAATYSSEVEIRYLAVVALAVLGDGQAIVHISRLTADQSEYPGHGIVSAVAADSLKVLRSRCFQDEGGSGRTGLRLPA